MHISELNLFAAWCVTQLHHRECVQVRCPAHQSGIETQPGLPLKWPVHDPAHLAVCTLHCIWPETTGTFLLFVCWIQRTLGRRHLSRLSRIRASAGGTGARRRRVSVLPLTGGTRRGSRPPTGATPSTSSSASLAVHSNPVRVDRHERGPRRTPPHGAQRPRRRALVTHDSHGPRGPQASLKMSRQGLLTQVMVRRILSGSRVCAPLCTLSHPVRQTGVAAAEEPEDSWP